ncbi:UDP-2-acetamido-2,6-beta-L-arabino-hexul-4-ose reductase [Altererythrobacter sp. Root672]|uniref:UDP-2-acetamido-2,6-beta-L-arabino-hexul-4-ose reductase n=1 Tax=Altererythrobacter sp. Root672 TaxID=1736584 RepID=UPI0006F2768A|nr:NAD-dependent epimerase/dehydratase family protein [Altererythrobacter sp. Root672]KRA83189.1 capsular biosynthesis protein [Altererythrobacter sp. Root672]
MRVLVTGAYGFVGKNLTVRLGELGNFEVDPFGRSDDIATLGQRVAAADRIVHLAGANRPVVEQEFDDVNRGFTENLVSWIAESGREIPLLFASSIQADRDNAYGVSKRKGEEAIRELADRGNPCAIYRFPNIFGKWCRPAYNSVVATFCYNATRGLELPVQDPTHSLNLVYIDDVVAEIVDWLNTTNHSEEILWRSVEPTYTTTVGQLAEEIQSYAHIPHDLTVRDVGTGLTRALYATYVSYLQPDQFSYPLVQHSDSRGTFIEMLRTRDSGQVAFFTAHPGVTRGGHYHHTKTEKFLVVKGKARFKFRNIVTNDFYELVTSSEEPRIVDTSPGWSHDITNVGDEELIVMLWANEIFDKQKPDTVALQP